MNHKKSQFSIAVKCTYQTFSFLVARVKILIFYLDTECNVYRTDVRRTISQEVASDYRTRVLIGQDVPAAVEIVFPH